MSRKPKKLLDFVLWDPVATLVVILSILAIFLVILYLLGVIR